MRSMVPEHLRRSAIVGDYRGEATATVLVVDAEGSTKLAERLRPHGNAGAEGLADVLAAVFAPMVQHVVGLGGFVAEFAGDGIIGVFPGEADVAVPQATAAAMRIMADLSGAAVIETPDGPASLKLRAVVECGTLDWVVWTSPSSELRQNAAYSYFGPAIDAAQHGEDLTPGDVFAVGPNARLHLPDGVVHTDLEDGFVAVGVLDPVWAVLDPHVDVPVVDDAHRFYPADLAELDRGDYRDVVSVFLDLRHRPGSGADPVMAHLLEDLDARRGYLCDVIPRPDGGVRLFLLWGAPRSHQRDIGYALRFVDEIRAVVGATEMRAGVTRSTAFAGFVGTPAQASYTAIGSGVNLAARMCAAAEWGEIRVGSLIAERLDDPWRTELVGHLDYRGYDDMVETHIVTHVPPVLRPDRHEGRFVGRQDELDHLEDLLAPMWAGDSPGVLLVAGDAGSGKSRLLSELRNRLREREPAPVWLDAQADEVRTQALATLTDALWAAFGHPRSAETPGRLAAYVDRLAVTAPDLAPELAQCGHTFGDLIGIDHDRELAANLDPRTRFENAVGAMITFVRAETRSNPVIVSVANGQWIDPASAEVIERLRTELSGVGMAIVIESRFEGLDVRADATVRLGGLSRSEMSRLAEDRLEAPTSEPLLDELLRRSEGNPLFAVQLLDYMERNSLVRLEDGSYTMVESDVEVPVDVLRLLVARIDELAPDVRRVVQIGAVLGREFDIDVLRSMASDPTRIDKATSAAVGAGLWEWEDHRLLAFRDLLVRDAAYGMLLQSDVRDIHGAAAAAIESVEPGADAAIAHHLDLAGKHPEAAVHYVAAGIAAAKRFDNDTALDHLVRARELAGDDDEIRFDALAAIHDVHDVLGDRGEQRSIVDAMANSAVVAEHRVDVAINRARLLASLGEYSDAETVAATALADAAGITSERIGSLTFIRAQLARYQGRVGDAKQWALEARDVYEAAGDQPRVASVDDFLGGLAYEAGDFDEAAALHRSAANVFREHGRATEEIRALNNLGSVQLAIGDYSAARRIHEAGAERSREIGYRMGEGDHLDNVGGTAWAVGDHDLAIERYSEALRIRTAMNDTWGMAISTSNLGAAHLAKGEPTEAIRFYSDALAIDESMGRRRGEAFDHHGIGLCQLLLGRYDLACESLTRAATVRSEIGEDHLANESLVACAVGMKRRGDVDEAVAAVLAILDEEGDTPFEGAVETTAALLRCIEVLEHAQPERAEALRALTARRVISRSERISDPEHRASYLAAKVHAQALGEPD